MIHKSRLRYSPGAPSALTQIVHCLPIILFSILSNIFLCSAQC